MGWAERMEDQVRKVRAGEEGKGPGWGGRTKGQHSG